VELQKQKNKRSKADKHMANIKLKLGSLELEAEGPEEFLKTEVPNFLKLAVETYGQIPATTIAPPANGKPHINGNSGGPARSGNLQGTTETIAAKLGVRKSTDLAVAAAARLAFVEGKDSFTHDEILGEMRTAKAYFKSHHGVNLRRTLRGLVKDGVLNGIAADTFAFSAGSRTDIEGRIHAQA
jgi:hypothetical protein